MLQDYLRAFKLGVLASLKRSCQLFVANFSWCSLDRSGSFRDIDFIAFFLAAHSCELIGDSHGVLVRLLVELGASLELLVE